MMKKIIMILAAVLMCGTVSAQKENEADEPQRKKVAVVLSGGGAKGMAHIGVLKVLEKAGIPVDYITGTSMGSIIGGLYAIGYNSHSLDSMVRVQDWSYVITDKENLRNQSLSDRKKQNTYFFSTGMTLGKKDQNAGGIIKGKNLAELFQQLCVGFTDSVDFNRLPIPFACVATDIITNEEVDFHSGRLPQAMRASMAIPAAFSPVRIGNKVLVDGGLKNNYPVDIAREMGAEIVIGVTVQGPPKEAEDMGGTMSILSQIIDVNCKNKVDDNIAMTDLHMAVDTKGYNAASFSLEAIDTLVRRGEEEAMRHWDQIMALKERIGVEPGYRPELNHPLRPQVMTEKHRILEPMKDYIDAKLEQELTTSMRVDLFYQTAECNILPMKLPKLAPRSLYNDEDRKWKEADGVRVILTAGERKSVQFQAGFRYDSEEYAAVQLGLDIPFKTAVPMSTDITVRLGKRLKTRAELTIHPRSFTRPTLSYEFRRNDVDVFLEGDRAYNVLFNQFQGELIPFNNDFRHFNIQLGLRWDYMHYRDALVAESSRLVTLKNEHFFSYRARLNYNSEDNWYFPTRGARFKAEYAYLTNNFAKLNEYADDGTEIGKTTGMSDVSADWRMSFTFGERFTLQPMLYGRLLFGSVVPPVFGNTVGGEWFGHYIEQQMPFAGIGNLESVERQFVAAQLQAQQRIGRSAYLLLRVAGAQKAAKVKELLDYRTLLGVQGAFYYNTMFGPVGASLGYSNRTKKAYFYLNLGYEF